MILTAYFFYDLLVGLRVVSHKVYPQGILFGQVSGSDDPLFGANQPPDPIRMLGYELGMVFRVGNAFMGDGMFSFPE